MSFSAAELCRVLWPVLQWLMLLLLNSAATLKGCNTICNSPPHLKRIPHACWYLFVGRDRPRPAPMRTCNPYGNCMPGIIAALDLQALIGLPDGPTVGYLRLHYFSSEGTTAFTDALRFGEFYGVAGWLIDLRNNPGKGSSKAASQHGPAKAKGTCKCLWCNRHSCALCCFKGAVCHPCSF